MLAEVAHFGQEYQGRPYVEAHVSRVVAVLWSFGFEGEYLAAGWLHDAIEDTEVGAILIHRMFGQEVASLVLACTGVGHNRKARNACIYERIAQYPRAAVVKLADRIANVEASAPGSSHRKMYQKEADAFAAVVRPHVPEPMWARLERALRDSDGSPEGRDAQRLDGEAATARADEGGIAQPLVSDGQSDGGTGG